MHNILIVSALSTELNIVKSKIKKLDFKNIKTSFLSTGIGNYNMILSLTKFLKENNNIDLIINIGVCGYKNDYKKSIQVGRIKNLSNNRELIVPNIIDFSDLESIASSEKIIFDSSELLDENFVDMESYGFEMVCNNFGIPRIILKVPVDKIGIETKNFDIKKAKQSLKENLNYELLFDKIKKYLYSLVDNNIGKKIKEKILSHFTFSFSEKIILEKLVNRFIVLEIGNMDLFFEENKDLNKKEFLKKLGK